MERRNFIKLTGASLASLLVTKYMQAEGASFSLIGLPEKVAILSGDAYLPMRSLDGRLWSYRDVIVRLVSGRDAVSVFVQSPTLPLKEVQLCWKYAAPQQAKILGDAWERTYADMGFSGINPSRKMPWYCVAHSDNGTACFGVKTGCSAFCYWRLMDGQLVMNLDTRNGDDGVLLGGRELHGADIVTTKGREGERVFSTVRRFCRQMCERPLTVRQPVYGINDWYFAYGKNSADLILKHTSLLAPLATNPANRPFSVIDDGWSRGTDFSQTNEKFPDMPDLTRKIKDLGMRPGLWTRPLLPKPGESANLFINGRGQILDPTIEENIQRVKSIFRLYREWGFEMVKHDYTTFDLFGKWGADMHDGMTAGGWQFHDRSKTNCEIILHLYRAMREAAGNMYLIGCNAISHLSAGMFELYRIGDDTSGKEWKRTRDLGVNTMGFRMVQHRNFYEADGDCVGLTTAIPWEKNKQWMQLLAQSSAPLFISAQAEAVGAAQKAFIRQCFDEASREQSIGEPLDWLENAFPAKWKLDGKVVEFNWA